MRGSGGSSGADPRSISILMSTSLAQSTPVVARSRVHLFRGRGAADGQRQSQRRRVTRACFHEPMVNRTYAGSRPPLGTAISPARPHHPKDKSKVEVGVQIVGPWILARLRNQRFFSLAALNEAIRGLLIDLNDRTLRGWEVRPFQVAWRMRPSRHWRRLRPLPHDDDLDVAWWSRAPGDENCAA
jgi:hypothetical protein